MKSVYYLSILSAIVFVNVACSPTADDKKATIEELKGKQAELATEIETLEAELAAMNPDTTEAEVRSKEVLVKALTPKRFDYYVQTQGTVEAENNVLVSAKSMGVITQVFVSEGQSVEKGQTLAQIDNSAMIKGIEEVKVLLALATTIYDRQKNLWDQKIGSEIQFLQAKAGKEGLEKRLASMNEQNDMSRIKAPISGTVDAVRVKVGENIVPGMPAFRVVNTSDLRVKASISEAFSNVVKKGNKVLVKVAGQEKEIVSKVSFSGRTIDPLSRSFDLEVALSQNSSINPNQTAVLKVIFKSVESAIVIPVNIVQDINGEKVIYVAEGTGKNVVARKKVISISGVYNNQAQVLSGLEGNERIITVGYQGLNDGEAIKI